MLTPDKLEYVWMLFPLFILFVFHWLRSGKVACLLIAAIALPNLVQIHFFDRVGNNIRLDVGLSPGVIVQERSERLKHHYLHYGDYEEKIRQAALEKFQCKDYAFFLTNETGDNFCMVVHRQRLRFYNPDRKRPDLDKTGLFKKKVIVFDMPDHRAWRQFFKFSRWKRLEMDDFELYRP